MEYKIAKVGLGEKTCDVPEDIQQKIHVVGVIYHKETFHLTHATPSEALDFYDNISLLTLEAEFDPAPPPAGLDVSALSSVMGTKKYFVINKVAQHKVTYACQPACWLAWYDGHPDKMFFAPLDIFYSDNLKRVESECCVYALNQDVIDLRMTFDADSTFNDIIKEL